MSEINTLANELVAEATSPDTGLDTQADTQQSTDGQVDITNQEEQGVMEQPSTEKEYNLGDDSRATTYWKGEDGNVDPNQMYKHIKHLEKKQGTYDKLQADYTSLEEKNNELQSVYDEVNSLLNDPNAGPMLKKTLQDIEYAKARAKYGELSEAELSYRTQHDEKLEQTQREITELRNQIRDREHTDIAKAQIGEIETMAKEYGIDPNISGFLNYVKENQVPVNLFKAVWKDLASEQIYESVGNKRLELERNAGKQTMSGAMPSSNSGRAQTSLNTDGMSIADMAKQMVGQAFGS